MTTEQQIEVVDRGDVYLEPIRPPDCDNCLKSPATMRIRLDLRELGMSVLVGHAYCDKCAPTIAKQLQAALPKEQS